MLSISLPMKGVGKGDYYLKLAKDDYYTRSGAEPGVWFGSGARHLGLGRTVEPDRFKNLLFGKSADGAKDLVQNASSPKRQNGWDLTLSAPKSVSLLWAFGPPDVREQVEAAERVAVEKTLDYIEKVAGVTRRGQGGHIKEKAGLAFALFRHGASRSLDPQLHTHCVLTNIGVRADKTTGALQSKDFFCAKLAAGAVYQESLAAELRERLGVKIVQEKVGFRIDGIPHELCRAFSTRRAHIEQVLAEQGLQGGEESKHVSEKTRPKKLEVARDELFSEWRKRAEAFGWSEQTVRELLKGQQSQSKLHDGGARPKTGEHQSKQIQKRSETHSHVTYTADTATTNRVSPSSVARRSHARNAEHSFSRSRDERDRSVKKTGNALSEEERRARQVSELAHRSAVTLSPVSEQQVVGSAPRSEKPHRLWTASRISTLDPRKIQTDAQLRKFHARYVGLAESRALLTPVISSQGFIRREQQQKNRNFGKLVDQQLKNLSPSDATLPKLAGAAVAAAYVCGADAWALFWAVRNLTELADQNPARKLFRGSFYSRTYRKLREIARPAPRWGAVRWEKPLFFFDLRIQNTRPFNQAPTFNPLRYIELPAFQIVPKVPDWVGLVKRVLAEPKNRSRDTSKSNENASKQDGYSQTH